MPRDINKQSSLAKRNKQRLQKIPVVEIALIMKNHPNWTIFYLHVYFRIRQYFSYTLYCFEITPHA